MSLIKIMPGSYSNPDALERAVYSCAKKEDNIDWNEWCIGQGVSIDSLDLAIADMKRVKKQCQKEDGRQLFHMMINLKRESSYNGASLNQDLGNEGYKYDKYCLLIAHEISKYLFSNGLQCLCFKHNDPCCRNLHFIINSVNFISGNKLNNINSLAYNILKYLKKQYGFLQWQDEVYY